MADAGLLVPGTGSSALRDSLGHDLGDPSRPGLAAGFAALLTRGAEEAAETLGMEHRPGQWAPLRTSLAAGRSILPGRVFGSLYEQIPDDYAHFLYDWRADLRYNAARLLRFLQERTRKEQRWHVVGHSQGALLIVLASKLCEAPDDFSRLVGSVRLIGAPLAGSVSAAQWLIDGGTVSAAAQPSEEGMFAKARGLLQRTTQSDATYDLQQALRSWPALYQMLPAWPAVTTKDGGEPASDGNLLSADAWSGHEGISGDLLRRATETRDMLSDPLSHLQNVRIKIVLARTEPTPLSLIQGQGPLTSDVGEEEPGDTLIPHDRTLSVFGGALEQHVVTVGDPCDQHETLLCEQTVWKHARARPSP